MRFRLIDRVVEFQPGASITAIKRLSPDEEYLQDHFPRFPVMPGVLMLEAMYQASAWLVRISDEFAHSQVLLKEARNIKYAGFVEPGQTLVIKAEVIRHETDTTTLKAQGTVNDRVAVSGRLVLERFNLSERAPTRAAADAYGIAELRREWESLWQPAVAAESV